MELTSSLRLVYKTFPAKSIEPFPNRTSVKRPVVDILLCFNHKSVKYSALIDSGADYCIFHAEMADLLGLEVKKGKKLTFFGTGGEPQVAYFHIIEIELGGWPMDLYCGFCYDMKSLPYGILGQTGFFDRFKIEFDYQNKRIEIKPKRK